jgi:thioredoxin-related protein
LAKSSNKLILLNFSGSDWCGPCIQLKKEVFESEQFKAFAEGKLVLVRADFPRLKKNQLEKSQQAKNDLMAEKYNTDGKFPLTVLINADGKVMHKWEGFQPSISKFIQEIEAAK